MHLVGRPYKGTFAYEWQIGPLVLQWHYKDSAFKHRKLGRFHFFKDNCWR